MKYNRQFFNSQIVRILNMQKHSTAKPGTPSFVPSKSIIASWLKSIFPDLPLHAKIEDFGDGVIYCRLLNHFYANPPHSKITWAPKNQYQYANNLKHVQTALLQLGITIPFDVSRVSKRKFLQNWSLINAFYRHFNSSQEAPIIEQNSASSHGNHINAPPMMSYQNMHPSIMQHQPVLQPPHQSMIGVVQPQKISKRPQSMNYSYPEPQQKAPMRQNIQPSYNSLNQHPQAWDHNLGINFATLATNSLQMTHYLKENMNLYNNTSSPTKGKWSVGSQMFQNNHNAVVDRVKQILLKASHDTQKVRQIKMLLGMPIQQQEVIKIQDDQGVGVIVHKPQEEKKQQKKEEPKIQQIQFKETKEFFQFIQKEGNSSSREQPHKISVSKTPNKKPFKI